MQNERFAAALEIVLAFEGGYVHDPRDPGGETYRGVSRRYHPGWPGWAVIDAYKEDSRFPGIIDADAKLPQFIQDFYRREFWDRVRGDRLPGDVALLVFDTAVNMGVGPAVKMLQKALNNLLPEPVLAVDGIPGPATLAAVASLGKDAGAGLCPEYLALREERYRRLAAARPSLQKFLKGWLRRLDRLQNGLRPAPGHEKMAG
jgi:lysozyme family protein